MYWLYLLYYVLLILLTIVGLGISLLGLPGLWLVVAATVVFTLVTSGAVLSWQTVLVVAGLAVASEIVEFVAGAAGSKTAGGTWRGIAGAVVGGVAGGIVGVPIPVVGPLLGAVLGAAIGAGILELTGNSNLGRAGNIALGAAKGRAWGIASKATFGTAMLLMLAIYAFPHSSDVQQSESSTTSLESPMP